MSLKDDFAMVIAHYRLEGDERAEYARLVRAQPEQALWVEREAQRIRGESTHGPRPAPPNAVGITERIKTDIKLKVKCQDG